MSAYYPAVMAQVDFACSVLGFIKRLLRAVLPALARDRSILGTKEQFRAQIDAAFAALNPHEATERDYRLAVANAACAEVAKLCEILTGACMCLGFSDIAKRYLDARKFIALVLGQDKAQIDALFKLVREGDGNLGRLLMRVGAILEGRPDTYDDMDAAAKRKATVDTKKIIAEVKTIAADMSRKIDEGKAEIVEHVDAVGAKVDKLKFSKKRKSKYSDTAREACLSYWDAAQNNSEIRHSINTRITHDTVFRYFARQLAEHGVTTVQQFTRILHTTQSLEYSRRVKKLDAQRDGRRKEVSQTPPKNGKMAGVKNTLKAVFALTLATIGVAAPCAASERAVRISDTPPPRLSWRSADAA